MKIDKNLVKNAVRGLKYHVTLKKDNEQVKNNNFI